MSRFKQIKSLKELSGDEDEVTYYIQYSSDMTEIMLTIKAARAIKPDEYFDCLHDFLNNVSENPGALFVESIDPSEALH